MIYLPESTRNQYKDYDRQMQVFGNLYLAERHYDQNGQSVIDYSKSDTTINLIKELVYNQKNQLDNYVNRENRTIMLVNSNTNITSWVEFLINDLPTNTQLTLSCYYNKDKEAGIEDEPSVNMFIRDNNDNILTSVSNLTDRGGSIVLHFTTSTSTIKLRVGINISQSEYANTDSVAIFDDLMLVQGTNAMPFERAYSSPFKLTEENNCKILSYNINEKADIYLKSLPYNTLTIEVDNESGYFTDYSPNSIVPRLNSDCYVDLFIKINDGEYYKIMKMSFDKVVSTDYEKAKLQFKSAISKLNSMQLKDKDYDFFGKLVVETQDIANYFDKNYGIGVIYNTNNSIVMEYVEWLNSPKDLLLHNLYYLDLITTNYNDEICYKTVSEYEKVRPAIETIGRNLQLERPIIKKENTYQGVIGTWYEQEEYETKEYKKEISGKLEETTDTIVIIEKDWLIDTLTNNDITITGNVNVVAHTTYGVANIVVLEITGNIGAEYKIKINKSAVSHVVNKSPSTFQIGYIIDKNKKLVIDETVSIAEMYYYELFFFNTIKSYVEVKCIGLPYLEVGDMINIQGEENTTTRIIVTEINKDFDGGLTMTIKGYELDIDVLFPADDLYPSDTLYPNSKIY